MTQRRITLLDDPSGYVGLEKDADKVMLVLDAGTDHEVCILMGAVQTLYLAQQLDIFGNKLLDRQTRVIERHRRNTEKPRLMIERERPAKLDA